MGEEFKSPHIDYPNLRQSTLDTDKIRFPGYKSIHDFAKCNPDITIYLTGIKLKGHCALYGLDATNKFKYENDGKELYISVPEFKDFEGKVKYNSSAKIVEAFISRSKSIDVSSLVNQNKIGILEQFTDDEIINDVSRRNLSIETKSMPDLITHNFSDEEIKILSTNENLIKKILKNDDNIQIIEKALNDERMETVEEFKRMLQENLAEPKWQNFFEQNIWLLGHGFTSKIVQWVKSRAKDGSVDGDQTNERDALMKDGQYRVLIEIKKPSTNLMVKSEYRNNIYTPDLDLRGGVAQLQYLLEDLYKNTEDGRKLRTIKPKGLLVVGNIANEFKSTETELINGNKVNFLLDNFQIYRNSFKDIEIITFDELYQRARDIVDLEKDVDYE